MNIKMVLLIGLLIKIWSASPLYSFEYTVGLDREDESTSCSDQRAYIDNDIYEQDLMTQGGMGVCYAHSVAQIYGSMHKKIYGTSVLPSPMMISINASVFGYKSASFSHASWPKKLLWMTPIFGWEKLIIEKKLKEKKIVDLIDGGQIKKVFKDFHSYRVCSYGPVEDFLSIDGDQQDTAKMLELLYDYLKIIFSKHKEISQYPPQWALDRLKAQGYEINDHKMIRLNRLQNYLYVNRRHIKKHFFSGKPYIKRTLGYFFRSLCTYETSAKIKLGKHYSIDRISGPDSLMASALNRHFSGSRVMPVEMGYCVNHLTGKGDGNCGYHSSVIYGKRCVRGRLQYLVRNSWGGKTLQQQHRGRSSDAYDSYGQEKSIYQQMKGDFWITEGFLKTSWTKKHGDVNLILLK